MASAAPSRRAAKGEGCPEGRALARGTRAPGGHRADPRGDPRPRRLPGPGRRGPACSSPHFQAGPRCRPTDKSVQLTRREKGRRSRSPAHHPRPPARPPLRASRSPARDSPLRAAVLRSNQAALPPLFSALFYLLRSLPRSLAPAYLLISLGCLPRSHPPLHLLPQVGGDKSAANQKKGPAPPLRPLPLAPPTGENAMRGSQ